MGSVSTGGSYRSPEHVSRTADCLTSPTGQQITFTATEHYPAGTVLTLQCPSPSRTPTSHHQPQPLPEQAVYAAGSQHYVLPAPPLPAVNFQEEDHNGSLLGWGLYACGCVACIFIPITGLILWIIVASLFYCKPQESRANLPRQKSTAVCAVGSSVACTLVLVLVFFAYASQLEQGGINPQPWSPNYAINQTWHQDSSLRGTLI